MKNGRVSVLRRSAAMDLTVGKPLGRILLFMLPLLIGTVFQQFYSLADTVVVGQTLGKAALGGVGSTGCISFLITGFVGGLTQGYSVVTSQRFGARDDDGVRRSFANGIVLTVVIVGCVTAVAVPVAGPLLRAINTDAEYYPYALEYITVVFGGMLLSAMYNHFASTLRAVGDSAVPLYFLIFSSFVNIGLDCLFILKFDLGVKSAALATLVSQTLSAALTFVYIWFKYPWLRPSPRHFRPSAKRYWEQLKLGLPMGLQMSVISIGMIFGQKALNTLAADAVPAYTTASKTDGLATSIIGSFGSASATFVGQNYGAKRYDRIKTGLKQFTLFGAGLSAVLGITVIALNRPMLMMFIPEDERTSQMFDYALEYLIFNGGFYVLLSTLCIFRSALQGMGRGTVALAGGVAEVFMRVGVSIIAEHCGDYTVVCLLNSASWMGANVIFVPCLLCVLKKYIAHGKTNIRKLRLENPSDLPAQYKARVKRTVKNGEKRRITVDV